MVNLLDHLIADEIGTTAFLATLIDPRHDHPVFAQARKAIVDVLGRHGLPLSELAPTFVDREYQGIDLVAVWSGWTLLLENKVAAASVTRGQLQNYYEAFLLQLAQAGALPGLPGQVSTQPVCVVFLTPSRLVGAAEFASLELARERRDKKILVAWDEIMEGLLPLKGASADYPGYFFDSGIERIRSVLAAAAEGQLPPSEVRSAIQALMLELRRRLQSQDEFAGLSFSRWSDRAREQLFAAGPAKSAYVGLYLSVAGSACPSGEAIRAVGEISFDAASKQRARLRGTVDGRPLAEWSTILGLPRESLQIDSGRQKLAWRFAMPEMPNEDFLRHMELHLTALLRAFRPILLQPDFGGDGR